MHTYTNIHVAWIGVMHLSKLLHAKKEEGNCEATLTPEFSQ